MLLEKLESLFTAGCLVSNLALWFRRSLNLVNVFFSISGVLYQFGTIILVKMSNMLKSLQTDDRRSWKFTWAFSSWAYTMEAMNNQFSPFQRFVQTLRVLVVLDQFIFIHTDALELKAKEGFPHLMLFVSLSVNLV